LTTEQSFVDALELLQTLYAAPLEHSKTIDDKSWHLIFGHIEVLLKTHSNLIFCQF
jgi:hypothetical protein